jgi:micrococcal nuclease
MRPVALLLTTLVISAVGCSGHQVSLTVQAPATFPEEPGGHEDATVLRVVDGDTIEVRIDAITGGAGAAEVAVGDQEAVRLVGIDTPESVKRGSPVECFGKEASAAAGALLEGARVRLVKDVEEKDRYGRLLRYVYIGDEMANARLVVNGYANAYTYPPNVRHADLFVQLESEAREGERGLWSAETCDGESRSSV